jgi:hypothetical protein
MKENENDERIRCEKNKKKPHELTFDFRIAFSIFKCMIKNIYHKRCMIKRKKKTLKLIYAKSRVESLGDPS